jgi:GDP-mannose 6-dehydrogenase
MKVSIFGLGYVGCVSMGCLAQNGHQVIGVDIDSPKVDLINSGRPTIIENEIENIIKNQYEKKNISATLDVEYAVMNSEISIITVGTPSSEDGHLNLSYVFKVIEQISQVLKRKNAFHIIILRSTVTPGTVDRCVTIIEEKSNKKKDDDFAVVSNPEFLREGSAVSDYYNPPFTLIGSDNMKVAKKVSRLYKNLTSEVIITDIRVAEIMKYVNNTYHALKIGFANEIGNICQKIGIDSHKVMDIFIRDKQLNISPVYFKPGFAYGGSCLPKDLKGLQTLAHDHYENTPIIESIDKNNELQIQKAIKLIIKTKGKNIGFFGLSFKANTDDLRNSPSVKVIETLLGKGYQVRIFDKNVRYSHITGTNKRYIEKHIPHLTNLLCNSIEEILHFSDVIVITINDKLFIKPLLNVYDKPIIDLVRIDEKLINRDNYFGICW